MFNFSPRMSFCRRIRLSASAFLSAGLLILTGCGGGSSTPPSVISVSFLTGTSGTVGAGQSIAVTASVANDSSGRGVTWTLTGAGTLSKQGGQSVEYDAPAMVASATTATITAAAVADPSKFAVFTVNLVVIAVSVAPASASVPVNTTQNFSAAVQYDGSNAGVTWSLMQAGAPCSPACGSVAPTTTAAGAPTTFTPSSTMPVNVVVTLTATSVTDTTRSSSAAITIAAPLPVAVSVDPGSASIITNAASGFIATVLYDAANAGVTWSLTQSGTSCSPECGTVAPANTASGVSTTYTAPAAVPANPTVTLTATSVTDGTKSASATLTIVPPPISVSVGPRSVLMGAGSTQPFTAILQNDLENKGVTWILTEAGVACSPGCGTIVPTTTTSGEAATYAAPATPQGKVELKATSVADPTKSNCPNSTSLGCVYITVTNGTVKLIPASIDFGRIKIGTTARAQVSLTNTGTAALSMTNVAITGPGASVFSQTNNCATSVDAGSGCKLTVLFKPVGLGNAIADLVITDSSADGSQSVGLKGKGSTAVNAGLRAAIASAATTSVPRPTGQYAVGTRILQLVDSRRPDPYARTGAARELLVRFWYPASLDQGCEPAEYASPRIWKYISDLTGLHLPDVSTNSCLDAPVEEGRHSIVVFTHGFTGTFTDYTFLFEDLASRGYIVASVDHTYEATAVEFPDGRFVKSIPGSHFANIARNDEWELTFAVEVRLDDLNFVADQLRLLNIKKGSPFAGKLDTAHLAIAGHSLGGLTAFLGLERNPRFSAAVILDGVVPQTLVNATKKPVFILTADHHQWSSSERYLWQELHGPRVLVNLRGAEHLTPTDLVWLAKGAIRTGTMGPEKTIAAIREYVAAFLDANLRGQAPAPLLNEGSEEFPDVELAVPGRSLPTDSAP